jgi:hypothetical protein
MANAIEQDARAALMMKVARRVEEFLNDVAETDPNKLDAEQLETAVMGIVKELGLGLMKEVFRRADEVAPEVTVNGVTWGNRKVTPGTYTVKFGTFKLDRSGYQQGGRGCVMFPVDQRLGIVEARYSPAMARIMARTIAEMPPERGEVYLAELGLATVSSSTLHRIPQDMEAVYELDRAQIEAVVRGEARVPKAAHTVQVGMDGVMVPMDSEHARRRGRPTDAPDVARHERHYGPVGDGPADSDGKSGAAYHEASVGTLSFYDREGEHLETVYRARMPEYRKEALAAELEAELTTILEQRSDLRVAFASDGAETHWEHLGAMEQRLPQGTESRQLLDFCHGAKYLFDAAKLVEEEDEGAALALADEWRSKMRHRKDGAEVVIRALRYQRDAAATSARDQLDTIVDFFAEHHRNGRLDYKRAANEAFPIGTGPTEAAAKTVITVRMKRAGARYNGHGGQTVLTFRAALLSNRFDATMREIVARYSAEVIAA